MKKTIATVFNDRERLALDGQVSAALFAHHLGQAIAIAVNDFLIGVERLLIALGGIKAIGLLSQFTQDLFRFSRSSLA